ncbi:FRG domain-containing protein [Pandoraea pnomenusa]|uniref:FRG domain-containing protein n=2 Tax=Pandoraea pnomenusa TaxID=93220 RepID=A0ABY6WVD2_9BURK|nr:FRG domain-containing protein [Pandoraea pnomenusa]
MLTGQFFGHAYLPGVRARYVILNLDADNPGVGRLMVWGSTDQMPPYALEVVVASGGHAGGWTVRGQSAFQLNAQLGYVPEPLPGVEKGTELVAELVEIEPGQMTGTWRLSVGTKTLEVGSTDLRTLASWPALVAVNRVRKWAKFREWADGFRRVNQGYIFRGQMDSGWTLRTSLHRMGRCDLWRYRYGVFQQFIEQFGVATSLDVTPDTPGGLSRLLAFAQHHGLPTPMLDWSSSPYVAAFFAFSDWLTAPENKRPKRVRVYALHTAAMLDITRPTHLSALEPAVALIGASARDNRRMYAQQGHLMLSNVVDLEQWLVSEGGTRKTEILTAIDIDGQVAEEALRDLRFMGLTAAMLFPDLDGACRGLKHQMLLRDF